MSRVSILFAELKDDLVANQESKKDIVSRFFFSASYSLILRYRIGKYLYGSRFLFFRMLSLMIRKRMISKRSCDLSYNSRLGKNLRFPHPIGIVIGDGVIIKNNVTIFQQVTLGSHGKMSKKKNYPIIENGVVIYTGARIIGGVNIGENSIIGANSVVNIDVKKNSIAIGIPCKVIEK